MTSCSTIQKPITEQEEITAIQSLNLIKNLVRSGLSSIAYIRGMFPNSCFKKQSMNGITLHTLEPTDSAPRMLIDWIDQGCLPSLEKRYLEEIVFGIYGFMDDNAERIEQNSYLIESYNFQVRYHENDIVLTRKSEGIKVCQHIPTKQEISQATVSMIRSLITMGSTMPPLPEKRFFSMKLLYREDVTPDDYEPAFFKPCTDASELRFFSEPEVTSIGAVVTPYHELKLQVKTLTARQSAAMSANLTGTCPEGQNTAGPTAYSAAVDDAESATLSEYVSLTKSRNSGKLLAIDKMDENKSLKTYHEDNRSIKTKATDLTSSLQQASLHSDADDEDVDCSSCDKLADIRDTSLNSKCTLDVVPDFVIPKDNDSMSTKIDFVFNLVKCIQDGTVRQVPKELVSHPAKECLMRILQTAKSNNWQSSTHVKATADELQFAFDMFGTITMKLFEEKFGLPHGSLRNRKVLQTLLNSGGLVRTGQRNLKYKSAKHLNVEHSYGYCSSLPEQEYSSSMDPAAESASADVETIDCGESSEHAEPPGSSQLSCFSSAMQVYAESGFVSFSQSDIEASQQSSNQRNIKRKISTSQPIVQIGKRQRR